MASCSRTGNWIIHGTFQNLKGCVMREKQSQVRCGERSPRVGIQTSLWIWYCCMLYMIVSLLCKGFGWSLHRLPAVSIIQLILFGLQIAKHVTLWTPSLSSTFGCTNPPRNWVTIIGGNRPSVRPNAELLSFIPTTPLVTKTNSSLLVICCEKRRLENKRFCSPAVEQDHTNPLHNSSPFLKAQSTKLLL